MENLSPKVEVEHRIGHSKNSLSKDEKFRSKILNLQNRQRLLKCYIYSVLLYRCEVAR